MDPFTIGMLLSVVGGGMQIYGNMKQGAYEREQARLQAERNAQQIAWQKEQLGWQSDDLERGKDAAVGTLLTQTAAMGISGPSVDQAKGTTIGEFNRALSRIDQQQGMLDKQKNWGSADLDSFLKQSQTNQMFNNMSTLLTTGANLGFGAYQMNLAKPPAQSPPTSASYYRPLMYKNYSKNGSIAR